MKMTEFYSNRLKSLLFICIVLFFLSFFIIYTGINNPHPKLFHYLPSYTYEKSF